MDDQDKQKRREEIRDAILEQAKKGNVVFWEIDESGFATANLEEFISQPLDGLLYDLNRLPEVIVGFLDDPKWVNDYAVYLVIKRLYERVEELTERLKETNL